MVFFSLSKTAILNIWRNLKTAKTHFHVFCSRISILDFLRFVRRFKWTDLFFTSFPQPPELHTHRGGCIMCLDYGHFASDSTYFRLMRHFDPIASVLTHTLLQLQQLGFGLERGYLFGFSYGGQLATEAGRRIGSQLLGEVDSELRLRDVSSNCCY